MRINFLKMLFKYNPLNTTISWRHYNKTVLQHRKFIFYWNMNALRGSSGSAVAVPPQGHHTACLAGNNTFQTNHEIGKKNLGIHLEGSLRTRMWKQNGGIESNYIEWRINILFWEKSWEKQTNEWHTNRLQQHPYQCCSRVDKTDEEMRRIWDGDINKNDTSIFERYYSTLFLRKEWRFKDLNL